MSTVADARAPLKHARAIPKNVSLCEYVGCKETGRLGSKVQNDPGSLLFGNFREIAMAAVIIVVICRKPSDTYASITQIHYQAFREQVLRSWLVDAE